MFWMLREAGASYAEVARAAGPLRGRVRQVCQVYAYLLHRRSGYVTGAEPSWSASAARARSWAPPSGWTESLVGPRSSCASSRAPRSTAVVADDPTGRARLKSRHDGDTRS